MNKKLNGIHGWLYFYIFCSYWISPLFIILANLSIIGQTEFNNPNILYNNIWDTYKSTLWFYSIIGIILQWGAAYDLKNTLKPESVIRIKKLLIYYPLMVLLINIFFFKILSNRDVPYITLIIYTYFGPLIWYSYFSKSIRVKNTYFHNNIEIIKDKNIKIENENSDEYWNEKEDLSTYEEQLEIYIRDKFTEIKKSILQKKSLNLIYKSLFNEIERKSLSFENFKTICKKIYKENK